MLDKGLAGCYNLQGNFMTISLAFKINIVIKRYRFTTEWLFNKVNATNPCLRGEGEERNMEKLSLHLCLLKAGRSTVAEQLS